jgi:hypothetical protein
MRKGRRQRDAGFVAPWFESLLAVIAKSFQSVIAYCDGAKIMRARFVLFSVV